MATTERPRGAQDEASRRAVRPPLPEGHPPAPGWTFRVGVTGHRPGRLAGSDLSALGATVSAILAAIRTALVEAARVAGDPAAASAPRLRLVSPLAEGADRLVAISALDMGYELDVPLPFVASEYEKDFDDDGSVAEFRRLIAGDRARSVLELCGSRATLEDRREAYLAVGRMVLDHSDVLIAVWDGEETGNRGSLDHVVSLAAQRNLPVVWIEPRSLKVAVRTDGSFVDCDLARDFPGFVEALVRSTCPFPSPTNDGVEAREDDELYRSFLKETARTWSALGSIWKCFRDLLRSRPRLGLSLEIRPKLAETVDSWRDDWQAARVAEEIRDHVDAAIGSRFLWADHLARYYVNLYRSAFLTNYALAALSVILALTPLGFGWTDPDRPMYRYEHAWVVAELIALTTIIAIYAVGRRGRWHEKYIHYRLLAEYLRSYRYLACLGRPLLESVIQHEWRGSEVSRSWTLRYVRAVVADAGLIPTRMDSAHLESCRRLIRVILAGRPEPSSVSATKPRGQVGYHATIARELEAVDGKLHVLETAMFGLAVIACILHLVGPDSVGIALTCLGAICPAVGAAVAGVRSQGDFSNVVARSLAMNRKLGKCLDGLDRATPPTLADLSKVADAVAETMLTDAIEWRFLFLPRSLRLPA